MMYGVCGVRWGLPRHIDCPVLRDAPHLATSLQVPTLVAILQSRPADGSLASYAMDVFANLGWTHLSELATGPHRLPLVSLRD
jgi:hypothetical protein